jgi:hypothetical protein
MTFRGPRIEAASQPGLMIQPSRNRPALKARAVPAIIPPSHLGSAEDKPPDAMESPHGKPAPGCDPDHKNDDCP